MSANMADTVVQSPTSPADTIVEKRYSRLIKLAILECVLGSVFVILCIIRDLDALGPLLVLQSLPGIVVVVCGLLPLFCKNNPTSSSYKCLLKGHFVLAITGFVWLAVFAGRELFNIIDDYTYFGYPDDPLRYHSITAILLLLVIIKVRILVWSIGIAGKLSCGCLRVKESDTNNYRPQQVVYVQQGTPENPQLIMMQPSAPNMQSIQPSFNGTVPSKAVVMQQGEQGKAGSKPAQNPVEVQTTSSPNQ